MLAQNLLYLKAAELQSSGSCGIKVAIIMIITQRLVYYHLSGHSSSRETARSRDVFRKTRLADYCGQRYPHIIEPATTPSSIFTKYRARYAATRFTCTRLNDTHVVILHSAYGAWAG